jgi:hypothetical protein
MVRANRQRLDGRLIQPGVSLEPGTGGLRARVVHRVEVGRVAAL